MLKPAQPPRAAAGFTIIELMTAVAILSILLVLGVPSMRGVVENTRIRTATESYSYGLAVARNDAVRLNAQVEFVMDATGWQVRPVADPGGVLHRGTGKEGTARLTITVTPNGTDRITYNSFGTSLATNPSDNSAPLTEILFESLSPPGVSGYRPLRLQLRAGGLARACDPAVGSTDPRACL